jgi:hypothetical protein
MKRSSPEDVFVSTVRLTAVSTKSAASENEKVA